MSRVYLIFRTQIFQEAVGAILKTDPAIQLVGAAAGIAQAREEIAAQKPDVIFVEQTQGETSASDLVALLNSQTPSRLILLHLDGDEISIWSPSRRQSVHAQDLLDAVLDGDAPDQQDVRPRTQVE